jgi:LPS-assembly protein
MMIPKRVTARPLLPAWALIVALGCAPGPARSQPQDCRVPVDPVIPEDVDESGNLEVTADLAERGAGGVSVFQGGVRVTRGLQEIEAEEVHFDPNTNRVSVTGRATYREPAFSVSAESASYDSTTGEARFEAGEFELPARPARGEASRVTADGDGLIKLHDVLYTTCMDDDPDWELRARRLELDAKASKGEARKVVLDFRGVPVAYFPYLSFPLNRDRKTGFLLPEFSSSDRTGTAVSVPWYWNIAPNYDWTITPRWMSDRGLQWNNEFRYLTGANAGTVEFEYLPDDDQYDDDRRYTRWQHEQPISARWEFTADVAEASDRQYFEDLGSGTSVTSQTHLLRNLEFAYVGDNWRFVGRGRNYQTIDSGIRDDDKPYERLPQLLLSGIWDETPTGLNFGLYSELVNFLRDDGVEGLRLNVQPDVSLPIEGPGYFVVPKVAWRHTQYQLSKEGDAREDPSTSAPIVSVDSGLLFERDTGSGNYVQTLEPRLLYAYIPSRGQDDQPIFDSGSPDFNRVQLFRPNRFVGGDRLGDTDQISLGVTSRLLDRITGREFLTATLGGAYYFEDRRVTLPGEEADADNQSDLVAEIGLDIFRNWNAGLGYQWDINDGDTSLAEFRVQYRPASNKVANLTYRYRPAILEQAELSLGWPVSERWSVVGQIEYSLRDDTTIERLVGVQYESCCWAARLASQRSVSNRDGSTDTTLLLQLDFKGLAGLGSDARGAFENDILGYSVYE